MLAEFTRLTTEGQRVNQHKSTLLTNFKKEGGDPRALKLLHGSLKLDPAEAVAQLERLVEYHQGAGIQLRWLETGQATIVDELGPEARKPAALRGSGDAQLAGARAHADGYNSGLHGAAPSDNPFSHQPGSEEYVEWHNGRDDGQRDRDGAKPQQAARRDAAVTADATLPKDGSQSIPF